MHSSGLLPRPAFELEQARCGLAAGLWFFGVAHDPAITNDVTYTFYQPNAVAYT